MNPQRITKSKIKRWLQYKVLPKLVDFRATLATTKAARKLATDNIGRILIDNTVFSHGVIHETASVDTGKSFWGGKIEIDTDFAARIPVHDDKDQSEATRSVRYLPGIVSLAKRGLLILATSDELRDEQWAHPIGRFRGYGLYDFSLFKSLKIETIKDQGYSMIIDTYNGSPDLREQRKKRLESKIDPLFRKLVSVLGPKNSQDAWHIATAEHNNCYCFLTMDFRLIKSVRAQNGNAVIQSLNTKILSPEEFGKEFSIDPIRPRLYSFHNAYFPVIFGSNWPDSSRQKKTSAIVSKKPK